MEAADGACLRTALFRPAGEARGAVVLHPGRTEFLEKYGEVIGDWQARGFAVLAHDWRGQGLSDRLHLDPLRGHARGWRAFLSDAGRVLDAWSDRLPRPWIALGHSMGGALLALQLVEGEARYAGAILSAPMLGLRTGSHSPASVRPSVWALTLVGRGGLYGIVIDGGPGDEPAIDLPIEAVLERLGRAKTAGLAAAFAPEAARTESGRTRRPA